MDFGAGQWLTARGNQQLGAKARLGGPHLVWSTIFNSAKPDISYSTSDGESSESSMLYRALGFSSQAARLSLSMMEPDENKAPRRLLAPLISMCHGS